MYRNQYNRNAMISLPGQTVSNFLVPSQAYFLPGDRLLGDANRVPEPVYHDEFRRPPPTEFHRGGGFTWYTSPSKSKTPVRVRKIGGRIVVSVPGARYFNIDRRRDR